MVLQQLLYQSLERRGGEFKLKDDLPGYSPIRYLLRYLRFTGVYGTIAFTGIDSNTTILVYPISIPLYLTRDIERHNE